MILKNSDADALVTLQFGRRVRPNNWYTYSNNTKKMGRENDQTGEEYKTH